MISNNLRRLSAGTMASLILPFHVPSGERHCRIVE
jgi:hypothetical protein